jgi:hypothetical protein
MNESGIAIKVAHQHALLDKLLACPNHKTNTTVNWAFHKAMCKGQCQLMARATTDRAYGIVNWSLFHFVLERDTVTMTLGQSVYWRGLDAVWGIVWETTKPSRAILNRNHPSLDKFLRECGE